MRVLPQSMDMCILLHNFMSFAEYLLSNTIGVREGGAGEAAAPPIF